MALANSAQSVISLINTIDTLSENFPMNIFSLFKGKTYSSVIEFLLDVLYACGVDTDEVTAYIISHLFSGEKMQKVFDWVSTVRTATSEDYVLESLNDLDLNYECVDVDIIEDIVKTGLGAILNALLSCSIYPIIPDWVMDPSKDKTLDGFISLPVSTFDLCKKLNIPPSTCTGSCFYQVDGHKVFKRVKNTALIPKEYFDAIQSAIDNGRTRATIDSENIYEEVDVIFDELPSVDKIEEEHIPRYFAVERTNTDGKKIYEYYKIAIVAKLGPNDMYRSNDLDAFMWYVLNKGQANPQIEENKMMWDSRLYAHKYFSKDVNRDMYNDKQWSYWLDSKRNSKGELYYSGCTTDAKGKSGVPGYNSKAKLFPIMQLEREYKDNTELSLKISLSSQRYRRSINDSTFLSELYPNKTMYTFNQDYLMNIRLFDIKILLASLVKQLYAYGFFGAASSFGFTACLEDRVLSEQLKKIINNIIEVDDMSVEDCYYTFSNKDYDDILRQYELSKYNAVTDGKGNYYVKTATTNDVFDAVDSQTNSATMAGTVTNITRSAYNVSDYGAMDEASDGNSFRNFLINFISAVIYPFAEQLFTPKVVLLICLNMQISGIVDFDKLSVKDKNVVINFIYKKLMAIVSVLIKKIKDYIISLIKSLVKRYITPLIQTFVNMILNELLENWLNFLEEMLSCIPTFNFNLKNYQAQIAEITYADIEAPENNIPESDKNC